MIFSNTSVLNFELGTSSDTVICTNLTLDGVLTVTDAGGFGPGTNTLFTYTGTLTDNGLAVNNPLPGGNTGTIDTTIVGQVRLIVTTAATPPVASFTATPTNGVASLNVAFTDTSTGSPTSWFWDFGDTGTSTLQNPLHSFAAGTWNVSLIASNAGGASSPAFKTITVITPQQYWENAYGVLADGTDSDGDGLSNADEYLVGFNPTNAAAYPHIINIERIGDDIKITFLASNGDANLVASRRGDEIVNNLRHSTGGASGGYTSSWTFVEQINFPLNAGTGNGIVTNLVEIGGATNSPARYYRIDLGARSR
jgi:PKD repeat protein